MSETNARENPVGTQVPVTSKSRARALIPAICMLVALLCGAAGFWLGRHESPRASGPATGPALTAAEIAERDEAAGKNNYQRVAKLIEVVDREKKSLELELNEDVLKKMAMSEIALGIDAVGTFQQWNGKQQQLSRLIEEKMKILSEIAGTQSRYDSLKRVVDEGHAPPDIEEQIRNDARYKELRHNVDEASRQVDELRSAAALDAQAVKDAERRSNAAAAKLEEAHEELKSRMSDALKYQLEGDLDADKANLAQIDTFIDESSKELGDLNRKVNEYRTLDKRGERLRQRIEILNDRITELRLFESQGITPNFLRAGWPPPASR